MRYDPDTQTVQLDWRDHLRDAVVFLIVLAFFIGGVGEIAHQHPIWGSLLLLVPAAYLFGTIYVWYVGRFFRKLTESHKARMAAIFPEMEDPNAS